MKIIWLGHASFLFEDNNKTVAIDPFLIDTIALPEAVRKQVRKVDYILLTHLHADHLGDTISMAKDCFPKIVGNYEICTWLESKGIGNCEAMNTGGKLELADLTVHMMPALHSSSIVDNDNIVYGGNPCGYVVEIGGRVIYYAGDTGIFLDMQLIQRLYEPEICILPIGDRFTMGPYTASVACNELLNTNTIIPMHYDTFPVLTGKPDEFKKLVKRGNVVIMKPGDVKEF